MDRKKIKIAVLAAASGLLILAAGGITAKMVQDRKTAAIETARMERETKDKEKEEERRNAANEAAKEQDDKIMGFSAESAKRVKEALGMRPPLVELTEENRREFARIASCRIDGEKGKIVIEASAEGIPVSDDKYYYLFAVESYEEEIAKDSTYLEQEYKDEAVEFQVERNFTGTEVSRKFVVAVKKNGEYVAVSRPHYITNPEAAAKRRSDGRKPSTKKGLLVDPNKLRSQELDDLGVKHAA